MERNAYLLFLAILFFCACKDTDVKNVDLKKAVDSQISALKMEKSDSLKFDLCTYIPFEWDSLVVVTGYSTPNTLKVFKFENQHVIRELITIVPERSNILLYIRSNRIVGFSDLQAPLLDFRRISNHYRFGYTIMYKKECSFLMTRRSIKNGHLLFSLETSLINKH